MPAFYFLSEEEYSDILDQIVDLESRVSNLESVPVEPEPDPMPDPDPEPEPDPTPDPEPDPTPDPDPTDPTDPRDMEIGELDPDGFQDEPCPCGPSDAHFSVVSNDPRVLFAHSYNDPDPEAFRPVMDRPHYLDPALASGELAHDPLRQAMRFFIPKGSRSLNTGTIPRPGFEDVVDDIVSVQWEWLTDPRTRAGGDKAFQVGYTPGNDDRMFELQLNHIGDWGSPEQRMLPSWRFYGATEGSQVGGNGRVDTLSINDWPNRRVQMHPSLDAPGRNNGHLKDISEGGTAKLMFPGRWMRITLSWDLSVSPARLKVWLDDTLTVCDPDNPEIGFLVEPGFDNHGINQLWMPEFNSSSTRVLADTYQWVRNVVVWKGADIPRST